MEKTDRQVLADKAEKSLATLKLKGKSLTLAEKQKVVLALYSRFRKQLENKK